MLTENSTICWAPSTINRGRNVGDLFSRPDTSTRSSRSFGFSKEKLGAACWRVVSDSSNRKMDSPTIGIQAIFWAVIVECLWDRLFSINKAALVKMEPCPAILVVYSDNLWDLSGPNKDKLE